MKIIKLLFASLYTAIPLMGIYALAIAVATFIENDYGSNAARVLIYNTWFFNFLHLWLLVCLIGVLIRYKFLAQKKYASFILHLSFVIIIVGAGITRFFGVEGLMNIREGQSNSAFISSEIFLNVLLSNGESKYAIHIPVSVSYASNKMLNEKIAFGDSHFRIKSTAITKLTSDKKDTTAQMEAIISYKDKDYPLTLIGGGQMSEDSVVSFDDGTNAILSWGARDIDLGFSIKLEDFILERYAGSNSPSSYKSKVVVIDGEKEMPYDIFMNNVLDYKGYRFFQSSYDMDELGTILSVNNDPGKIPTYIGYFLLFVACVWLLFAKNSRFQKLSRFLKNQKIYSVVFALVIGFSIFGAQYLNAESPKTPESKALESTAIQSQNILDYINNMRDKSKAHAQKFGTLQIQSNDGKIKPLDTLASDLVHKMTKKNNFLGFSNTQIALGMLLYPNDWKNIKMIRVSTPQLRELLGLPKDEKYASFMDLFITNNGESSATGEYKLKNYIEEANRKSPANRSKFDNDIIDVDERANIAYGIYSSQFFRFLPIPQNGEIWISPIEMLSFAGDELAGKIQTMLSNYFNAFEVGLQSGDFAKADEALQIIKDYQREFGGAIMISDSKLKAEIFLNNSNLFAKLILPYILVGIAMFILIFAYIFKPKDSLKRALKCFYFISCAIILVHLFALILRWYIAGHAPWSNAYESMLYIAFTAGIAGVVFFRKSYLALSSANFLAGIALFVANLGFMNPQITNLMPVLKSYWLNIHVSVITASYGFLGLCFLLGIITLMLMICRKKSVDSANQGANLATNQSANPADSSTANQTNPANLKIDSTINSITAINEMSMIFGLFLLTAGNFLGGIWANESWGRYWGWDPKETWALVSIGVYAIILHLRFIFKRNFQYIFATASVLGFFSVLMTYFGVNYYLSGLHSYAAGDPLPIPKFLYFMVAFLVILIIIAFLKRKMEAVKI